MADEGGALVGYVALTFGFSMEFGGRDAFIDDLYVVDSHRAQGIGRALIAACENTCKEAGVRALHLAVRPSNPAASLYRRLGFREQEHRLMSKRLQLDVDGPATHDATASAPANLARSDARRLDLGDGLCR